MEAFSVFDAEGKSVASTPMVSKAIAIAETMAADLLVPFEVVENFGRSGGPCRIWHTDPEQRRLMSEGYRTP